MNWLVAYLGLAALWAGAATAALALLFRLWKRPLKRGTTTTVGLSLFFLLLTQHPFPDPDVLRCPAPGTEPLLRPFGTLIRHFDAWRHQGAGALLSVGPLSAAANLLLCMAIGGSLAQRTGRFEVALALGLALTLSAELSQITGLWGLYPCPYRQFDVDDIILNLTGTVAGF